jgi:hypothetical protein
MKKEFAMRKYFLPILVSFLFFTNFAFAQDPPASAPQQQYDVLPHRGETYGHIWLSDGPALVSSENTSVGNRFRLGLDLRTGHLSRYEIGWTIVDSISSGETAGSVGDISRNGSGPNFGYYIIPDKLWLMYTFDIGSVKGTRVSGNVTSYGHQLEVGTQLYSNDYVSVGAELGYLYLPSVTVPVFDINSNNIGSANYPSAQIFSLNFVVGFNFD